MSKRCELTGVSPLKGHNVSHAKNKTKRRFLPNLKKVSFLNHVKAELQLKNIKVVHNRIEDFDLSKEDWIVSRAFSSPEELLKKIKEKAPRDLVFLMMVSKNIKPSILGYDVDYIESSAANILKKNRGFLKISLSKN